MCVSAAVLLSSARIKSALDIIRSASELVEPIRTTRAEQFLLERRMGGYNL